MLEALTKELKEHYVQQWRWGTLDTKQLDKHQRDEVRQMAEEYMHIPKELSFEEVISNINFTLLVNKFRCERKCEDSLSIKLVNNKLPTIIIIKILTELWNDYKEVFGTKELNYTHLMINKAIYQSIINYNNFKSNIYFTQLSCLVEWVNICEKQPYYSKRLCKRFDSSLELYLDILISQYIENPLPENVISKLQTVEELNIKINIEPDKDSLDIIKKYNEEQTRYFPKVTKFTFEDLDPWKDPSNIWFMISSIINGLKNVTDVRSMYGFDGSNNILNITCPLQRISCFEDIIVHTPDEYKPNVWYLDARIQNLLLFTNVTHISTVAIPEDFDYKDIVFEKVIFLKIINNYPTKGDFKIFRSMFPNTRFLTISFLFLRLDKYFNLQAYQYLVDTKSIQKLTVQTNRCIESDEEFTNDLVMKLIIRKIGYTLSFVDSHSIIFYRRIKPAKRIRVLSPPECKHYLTKSKYGLKLNSKDHHILAILNYGTLYQSVMDQLVFNSN